MFLVPLIIVVPGVALYALYLIFVSARRRAAERILGLVADAAQLDLPLEPLVESAIEDASFWERGPLRRLTEDLNRGLPLPEALAGASGQFPPLVVSQLETGLACGQLAQALEHAARTQRNQAARRQEMFGPLLYLVLLALAALGAASSTMVLIWPKFERIAESFGCTLPWPFGIIGPLVGASSLIVQLALVVGLASVILLLTGRQASGAGLTANMLDVLRWLTPGWHGAERSFGLAAAARHMSQALAAGATDTEALEQAARLKVNLFVRRRLAAAHRLHLAGQRSLAESFRRAGGFPRHFLWTVATGAAADSLPAALANLADEYETHHGRLQVTLWNAIQVTAVVAIGSFVALQGLALFTFWGRIVWQAGHSGAMHL